MSDDFETITYNVEPSDEGIRVDKVLANHPTIGTRSRAEKLINRNLVSINNVKLKRSHKVLSGDLIEIQIPKAQISELTPFDIELEIPYEDEDLLIVNKPSGLVVHPSPGHANDTLVNALISKNIELSMGFNEQRPGIVHRIDKDTSGVIVIAKNNIAHQGLIDQFKNKSVHRVYQAITYRPVRFETKTFESHLIRHPVHRKKYTIERPIEGTEPKGRFAVTHCTTLQTNQYLSLVKCQLETGRTHQIRIHLAHAGHPVVCDPIYSNGKENDKIKNNNLRKILKSTEGIGLHAQSLGFIHPRSKKYMEFSASWPKNLLPIVEHLGWV